MQYVFFCVYYSLIFPHIDHSFVIINQAISQTVRERE